MAGGRHIELLKLRVASIRVEVQLERLDIRSSRDYDEGPVFADGGRCNVRISLDGQLCNKSSVLSYVGMSGCACK